jgi:AcrR family transcriptional regulator
MAAGRRGAVRSEVARSAILAATSSLIERFGYDRVTIEGIASEAGVGKQTIYRWWPSKSAVVAECLFEGVLLPETYAPANTGDLAVDLMEWLERILAFVSVPAHEALIRSLIGAAVENAAVGDRLQQRLGASPDVLTERLRAALDGGQLRPGTSVQVVADALVGSILNRILLRPEPRPDEAHALVDLVLNGAGSGTRELASGGADLPT